MHKLFLVTQFRFVLQLFNRGHSNLASAAAYGKTLSNICEKFFAFQLTIFVIRNPNKHVWCGVASRWPSETMNNQISSENA